MVERKKENIEEEATILRLVKNFFGCQPRLLMMTSRSSGFTVRQTKPKSEKIEKIKWEGPLQRKQKIKEINSGRMWSIRPAKI